MSSFNSDVIVPLAPAFTSGDFSFTCGAFFSCGAWAEFFADRFWRNLPRLLSPPFGSVKTIFPPVSLAGARVGAGLTFSTNSEASCLAGK